MKLKESKSGISPCENVKVLEAMQKRWPIYVLLCAAMTCASIERTSGSSTFAHQIFLKENTRTSTEVADMADMTETQIDRSKRRNFKLLSQTLLPNPESRPSREWLSLDETNGIVTLRHQLDREAMCGASARCVVQLKIYIHSSAHMVDLDIVVVDVNEHAPAFPVKFIVVNVSEEAHVDDVISLDRYLARDADAGNNSVVSYSLSPSNHFDLVLSSDETGSQHLQIRVRRRLDYEAKRLYRMTLTATDSGSPALSSQVPLQVRVTDENDNSPIFDRQEYPVVVQENIEAGHVITRVKARDADSGKAGEIRYYLANRNSDFIGNLITINDASGEVLLKGTLDREQADKNIIYVEARDLGKPVQRVGRARVLLYVSDVNDNKPVISITYLAPSVDDTVYIPESSPFDAAFAYVNAKDADFETNGDVTISVETMLPDDWNTVAETERLTDYSKDLVSDTFVLNERSFLEVNRELDREALSRYKVVVKACDEAVNELCSRKTIHVVILDENDHAPVFQHSEIDVSVPENAAMGTVVATVTATDGDAVDPTAVAKDENDKIVASRNGEITYSLNGGGGCFSVDPKAGTIFLVRPLDREHTTHWEVVVTATDGGHTKVLKSMCLVNINVLDVNDNAPTFTNPVSDDATVYATILRDDIITRIQAVDYDEGANGRLKYNILSEDGVQQAGFVNSSLFILNMTTGDLRLNMSNPKLGSSLGSHSLVIQAADMGLSVKRSQCAMKVIVSNRAVLPTMAGNGKGAGLTGSNSSFTIIIAALASVVLIVLLISVVLVFRCRRKNTDRQTEMCKETNDTNRTSVTNVDEKTAVLSKATSKESISKESVAWSQTSNKRQPSITYDSTTDVTNLSRSDAVLSRQFPASGSSLERQGMLKCGSMVGSQNTAKSTLSVPPHDGDSGHGGSEPDGLSGDILLQKGYDEQRKHLQLTGVDSAFVPNGRLGARCSDQCLQLGHSDACWMPADSYDTSHCNLPAFLDTRSPPSDLSDKSGNLETIPETQQVRKYWSHMASRSTLNSIYSNVIPAAYARDNYADPRQIVLDARASPKLFAGRNNSTTDSTTTGYVTESEVI